MACSPSWVFDNNDETPAEISSSEGCFISYSDPIMSISISSTDTSAGGGWETNPTTINPALLTQPCDPSALSVDGAPMQQP